MGTLSDCEGFVVAKDDRKVRPRGSDENGSIVIIGRQLHCLLGWDSVRRNQHHSFWKGSEEGQVFQGHLTGTILSDVDTCVRTDHFNVGAADSRHSDLIGSSAEKGCESIAESDFSPAGKTSGNSDHVLLSDIALDEALWELFGQSDRESADLCVAIKGNHVAVGLAGFEKSVSVGLTSGDFVSLAIVGGSYTDIRRLENPIVTFWGKCFILNLIAPDFSLEGGNTAL